MADSADLVVLGAWYGTGQKGLYITDCRYYSRIKITDYNCYNLKFFKLFSNLITIDFHSNSQIKMISSLISNDFFSRKNEKENRIKMDSFSMIFFFEKMFSIIVILDFC